MKILTSFTISCDRMSAKNGSTYLSADKCENSNKYKTSLLNFSNLASNNTKTFTPANNTEISNALKNVRNQRRKTKLKHEG